MIVDFCVDRIVGRCADGWAWAPDHLHDVLTIEMVAADGGVAATTLADRFRADLSNVDKRAGWCAFLLRIPDDARAGTYQLRARLGTETVDLADPFTYLDA